jgi:hypothetical protein
MLAWRKASLRRRESASAASGVLLVALFATRGTIGLGHLQAPVVR